MGDVGERIPRIYATLDNTQVEHQASISETYGKLCDQVAYILIDPGSNYSYVKPNLMDKFGLNK